ncbi:hypothetical protein [Tumebacillus flagellatus]|uniref:Uncharacterized protein n=1 Tax=Tumebacillus flagellatus TaxID=1157490 RepID=A0A074LRP2_9BACL|nr:hypothetical protein [Tumebacillus flagellatus]KEO83130.1 hypothetical protein EL26_11720 [Tumebacillus flagellatus]
MNWKSWSKTRKVLFFLGAVVVLGWWYRFYYGIPWDAKAYGHEVDRYLREQRHFTEPYEQDVGHDFKNDSYYAEVHLQNGVTFTVYRNYDGELEDTYEDDLAMHTLTQEASEELARLYPKQDAEVQVIINKMSTAPILPDNTAYTITLHKKISDLDGTLQTIYKFFEWQRATNHTGSLYVEFTDTQGKRKWTHIPFDQQENVTSWEVLRERTERDPRM